MKKMILLFVTHIAAAVGGFGAGIYFLPILIAPPAPEDSAIRAQAESSEYSGQFRRDLKDSDAVHWGDGTVFVGRETVSLDGEIAPGPDYKLYLSPTFIETEADFIRLKHTMMLVGDVKTFNNFIVPVPGYIDPEAFNTVIVWCESFGQFITAAQYR